MKLFLHWLAWDLRRFRFPLLVWVIVISAFLYLAKPLLGIMFSPELSDFELMALLPVVDLWVYSGGALLTLVILSSDPAGDPSPHWKTRPPAGSAVAGAKLALVLFFFFLLPLIGCWLLLPLEWRFFGLFSTGSWQSLLFLHATLAASTARRTGHALVRLAPIIALSISVIAGLQFMGIEQSPSAARNFWVIMLLQTLWILAPLVPGVVFFIKARQSRTPSELLAAVTLTVPALWFVVDALLRSM